MNTNNALGEKPSEDSEIKKKFIEIWIIDIFLQSGFEIFYGNFLEKGTFNEDKFQGYMEWIHSLIQQKSYDFRVNSLDNMKREELGEGVDMLSSENLQNVELFMVLSQNLLITLASYGLALDTPDSLDSIIEDLKQYREKKEKEFLGYLFSVDINNLKKHFSRLILGKIISGH